MAESSTQAAPAATASDVRVSGPVAELLAKHETDLRKEFGVTDPEEFDPIRAAVIQLGVDVSRGYSVGSDVLKGVRKRIAELDSLLSKQVNLILHHPEFQKVESAWRGLEMLLRRKPDNEQIQVRVLNISKSALGSTLERYDADSGETGWDRSPIHRMIFESRFDTPGAHPFGVLIGDYEFSHAPGDVNLLRCMARNCGAAHVPFVAAAAPKMLKMKSWTQLSDPASLASVVSTDDYAKWNALRASEDSRYLVLTLPRVLARLPYGEETNKVEGFAFEEDLRPPAGSEDVSTHTAYCWANASLALGGQIMQSFHVTGFCTEIRGYESGGLVEGLPVHTFPTTDGGMEAKCPTEIAIPQRRESALSSLGLMPLSHYVGSDQAVFYGAQTVQKPAKYGTASATENAELSARLPYVFLVSRFAHYLKKMMLDKVGSKMEQAELEAFLNGWISKYTSAVGSGDAIKAEKPLADAKIEVSEIPGRPGFYDVRAFLRPHIQLEGVDVKLGVVSRVPGAGGT